MPKLTLKTRKTYKDSRTVGIVNFPRKETDKEKERKNVYNKPQWKALRKAKLMQDPLCECCKCRGKLKLAEVVHHADSFLNYTGQKQQEKALDMDNLISLCRQCHNTIHAVLEARNMTTTGQSPEELAKLIDKYEERERTGTMMFAY